MSFTPEWPPSLEAMHTLLPAFEFTAMVTSSDLGAVFFANQKSLDRQVALKVFSPALAADKEFRKAFGNSSKLAAGLRHANLIGLLDSGEVGGMPYLVMEFVPGKSLARSTLGQIVEFDQSLSIIHGITEGLAHAHDAGLVHGRLDNLSILLNQNALPKIGNFGFGRAVLTDPQVKVPTHFTAPEVLTNPSAASKASDVYSIAAIFHGLITGTPFSPQAAAPSSVCGCRPAVDSVLKRATDPDPLKRYSDARSFQVALNQATAKPAPTSSAPVVKPPLTAPLPKTGSDSKSLVKIAIIIALLVAIFFTWEIRGNAIATYDKERSENIVQQKLAKEHAAALSEAQNTMEEREHGASQPSHIPANAVDESPRDSLDRLRSDLAKGQRWEMPAGSVKKGDRTYFLVEERMRWAEASYFAEEHGAYLADPTADLVSWLDSELTNGREYLLGAARSSGDLWVLSDGEPWIPHIQPEGDGLFLLSGKNGGFTSSDANQSHPFVMEWRGDGANPGALANLLTATRASLHEVTPIFPPGTVFSGERRYLFVKRRVTWSAADEIAKSGGGHLLVAATPEEITDVVKITHHIQARDGIWLGATLENDLWQWITGEPWEAVVWSDGSAAAEEGVALVLSPGNGWSAMDRENMADGFLIEWSGDTKATKPGSATLASNGKVAELDAKLTELFRAAAKKREEEHDANINRLKWHLDSYLQNLSGTGRNQFGPSIDVLKELVDDNQLDVDRIEEMSENDEIEASMEMLKLVDYYCDKEVQINTQTKSGIRKIRDAYVTKITAIKDEAKAADQMNVAADLEEIIENAADLDSWAESFDAVEE